MSQQSNHYRACSPPFIRLLTRQPNELLNHDESSRLGLQWTTWGRGGTLRDGLLGQLVDKGRTRRATWRFTFENPNDEENCDSYLPSFCDLRLPPTRLPLIGNGFPRIFVSYRLTAGGRAEGPLHQVNASCFYCNDHLCRIVPLNALSSVPAYDSNEGQRRQIALRQLHHSRLREKTCRLTKFAQKSRDSRHARVCIPHR